jgi:hypothetical protein
MRRCLAFVVALCLATAARPLAGGSSWKDAWPGVVLHDPLAGFALARALDRASAWLASESCQQIFAEFADQRGERLADRLAALGVDGAAFLRWIRWRDGSGTPQCPGPLAYTMPGSRVVFVCTRQFTPYAMDDPDGASAIVIHEALHALGLGENPPSSREITRRVRTRCAMRTRAVR